MTRRIAILQGHPDAAGNHLLNAMADAYAEGATSSGHEVRRIEVAKLDFPLLRTQAEFESDKLPPALVQARDDMRWAEHWVFLFPLWHGTMPASSSTSSGRVSRWSTGKSNSQNACSPGARPASS